MKAIKCIPIKRDFLLHGLLLALLMLPFSACKKKPEQPGLFSKLDSTQTNINFINHIKNTDKLNILDYIYFYNGAGVATGDINNDGLTDIYFVSNSEKNSLYLNKGNFKFEDITEKAGIGGYSDWSTGVTMADVNGDGLLDIYVCTVGNYKGLEGANELYINNGDLTFTEKAMDNGLDFTGFSTQAAFFDYDKDGDLDMYLLNHAVHTTLSYDRVSSRTKRNNEAGDRLYKNEGGKFVNVSEEAGIFGPAMGYGLGVSVGDLNNDGWDDIYVGNDFHEDDYYYINNGNGTFTESLKNSFAHVSRFSMGNDMADINNDGLLDLITMDMYPEDEKVEKSSMGEDPFEIFVYKLNYGFYYQYSRNTLQVNMGGKKFSDIGVMAGVAASDWSWAPLLADYDNDGIKDLFVSNGIIHRPNDFDYAKYISTDSIAFMLANAKKLDQNVLNQMPEGKVHNFLYKGTDSLRFEDKSLDWGFSEPTFSNGAAYADLDNDGDLDLVTNDINAPAGIYRNQADGLSENSFLRVKLQGDKNNSFGIGAKLFLKAGNKKLYQHQMLTRGFLSAVDPVMCVGLGKATKIDSLYIIWPNQKMEVRTDVPVNTTLVLKQSDATREATLPFQKSSEPLFKEITQDIPIAYKHEENTYYDFNRELLMPFQLSTEGPALAVGDANGDGLDDFFVGGAKHQSGGLYIQRGSSFISTNEAILRADSVYEDVDAVFFDADNDKDLDLYVVTGGNEFYDQMPQLFDRLYLNDGKGNFTRAANSLPPMYANKSCVKPFDFDKDGDIDLFVGGRVVGYKYGNIPDSYLLINDGKGQFTDQTDKLAPGLRKAGMVTDASWTDYDKDGDADLLVVGDWMPIKVFENGKGKFTEASSTGLNQTNGLWQTIESEDFDKDGDTDFLVGNLGTNTKFRKRENSTLKMWVKDIDGNGTLEQIIAYNLGDKWHPVASKDELGKQLPLINQKYTSYKEYAGKTIEELFSEEELKDAQVREVNVFESVYLENTGNKQFKVHNLPIEAQVSKTFAFHVEDVDGDGNSDALLGGNLYGVSTYQGRYDASYGLLLKGNGQGSFTSVLPTESGFLLDGEIRKIESLKTSEGELFLVARNNQPLQLFRYTEIEDKVEKLSVR